MWVETRQLENTNRKNKYNRKYITVSYFVCDECGNKYEIKCSQYMATKQTLSFCSKQCYCKSIRCGKLNELIKNGWHSKTQEELNDMQQKMKQTTKERHGKETYRNIELCKETKEQKYGDPHYNNQEQNKITTKELYGDENYRNTEKSMETSRQKYGTDFPMQSNEVKSKIDWASLRAKQHITMKNNGGYRVSKIELKFFERLKDFFGKNDIEHLVMINNREIDFYIKSIDTYIQFDGIYWHGLDRNINEIKNSDKKRDEGRYKTYMKDREQDGWFKLSDLKLVRITDSEFINSMKNKNFDIIIKRIKRAE